MLQTYQNAQPAADVGVGAWPASNQVWVCLGCGPSLTVEDVEYCRGRASVIAINNTYQLAPWAEVLYACDARWWGWHKGVPGFAGLKFSVEPKAKAGRREHGPYADITVLRNTGDDGFEADPSGLRTGKNSGYQAINLAVHFGARRIILLGYDMGPSKEGRDHYFGSHPGGVVPPYHLFMRNYPNLAAELKKRGVDVINASRKTALGVFRRQPLAEALP